MSTNTKEYMAKWRNEHREQKRTHCREWAREHKAQISEYRKEYNKRPEVIKKRNIEEKERLLTDEEYYNRRRLTRKRTDERNKEKILEYRRTHTDPNQLWRLSYEYMKWQKNVYKNDNYKCQVCGKQSKLDAHHIKSSKQYPNLRYDLDNGICLCKRHHHQLHKRKINLTP